MEIEEVEEILGLTRFLRAPKHVFITDEPVYEERNGRTYFKGLQPAQMRGIIFLPRHADITTIGHEAWHSQTGLGELTAYPVGRLFAAKHMLVNSLPTLKRLVQRRVTYRETPATDIFPQIEKYRGRVQHYELEE